MNRFFAKIADRFFNKLALTLLARADEQSLHPNRLLLIEAQKEAADYAKTHMRDAIVLRAQKEILEFVMTRIPDTGLILEFGVGGADSTRTMAAKTSRRIHGFDSFMGLPEDWGGRHEEKGHYSSGGVQPEVPKNIALHAGLFTDTLPQFLATHTEHAALIHIDCDLYSSTSYVLNMLSSRIQTGTVILFDEYFNYPTWRLHEFKAFQEFVASTGLVYRYVAWSYQQVAVQIVEITRREPSSSAD